MNLLLRNLLLVFLAPTVWTRSTQANQADLLSQLKEVKPEYNRISESKDLRRLIDTFNRTGRNNQLLWTIYSHHLI